MRRRVRQLVAGAVVVAGTVAAGTGVEAVRSARADVAAQAAGVPTPAATGSATDLSAAFRRAASAALPGVVHVQVEVVRNARVEVPAPFEGTPWEELFRRGHPSDPAPRQGSGSGFVFRPDGYILTNNHVVAGAARVRVVLQDRRELEARVVGRDPNTDVAVLKVEAEGLPVVELGASDPVAVGDWVVALGYPLRLGATATAGIVSAKGRTLGLLERSEEAPAPLEHFIQTDAAINPGNSGGPLVDLTGRAIGMNTAIASPTGYYSGYGFAVPIDLVKRVADDLIRHGEVRRPRLGVGIENVDAADAEVYGLERPAGVEVTQVQPGTAAERAGLRLGDVILSLDGTPVATSGDLMELLARREPGETVTLEVVRYGERLRVAVKLGSFEPAAGVARKASGETEAGLARLGFRVDELTPALARRFGHGEAGGVVVVEVEERSASARAGLRPGMVIERVDRHPVETEADVDAAARRVEAGRAVSLVVRLPDGSRTIVNFRVPA